MRKLSTELSVGIFVLLGIICVIYLAVKLGEINFFAQDHYRLDASFASSAGLNEGASITVAGVKVGHVEKITLDKTNLRAIVTLSMRNDLELTDDTIASIKTNGLIGDRYIALQVGGSDVILQDGDMITETESALDIEGIISKFAHGSLE